MKARPHPLCADCIFIETGEASGENGPFSWELINNKNTAFRRHIGSCPFDMCIWRQLYSPQ